ncbi:response regulator transcription factor [uncultured Sphingomonas sp.]|uniref:LuxR C-terminal-related transcriptional regulator n=1 Tax=uncultured Sphingomonas sp. TaxID=158754 RepID=UPI0025E51073|nr:response regulator transcription factor [uncultured Sphingomonas sp.]
MAIGLVIPNEIVREGICHILSDRQFQVEVSVSSAAELAEQDVDDLHVVVMSLGANDSVRDACAALNRACPGTRHVLTALDFDMDDMVLAFESGIDGLILSDASCDLFAGSLRLVALGERVLPGKVADYLVGNRTVAMAEPREPLQPASGLSHREIDILRHLVNGDANKVIARRLNIAEATVKVHVKTILRKLQLANRTQAAIWATRHHLNGTACHPANGHAAGGIGLTTAEVHTAH